MVVLRKAFDKQKTYIQPFYQSSKKIIKLTNLKHLRNYQKCQPLLNKTINKSTRINLNKRSYITLHKLRK